MCDLPMDITEIVSRPGRLGVPELAEVSRRVPIDGPQNRIFIHDSRLQTPTMTGQAALMRPRAERYRPDSMSEHIVCYLKIRLSSI